MHSYPRFSGLTGVPCNGFPGFLDDAGRSLARIAYILNLSPPRVVSTILFSLGRH